jgi:hypothetical protein
MGKTVKLLLLANLLFWIYFYFSFARVSVPYDPRPLGHHPVEPYSFAGHSVGLTESIYSYPFMRVAFWIEGPSIGFVTLVMRMLFGRVPSNEFFAGISFPGYKLLAITIVSFAQWYLIGFLVRVLWVKWSNRPTVSKPG